MLRTTFVLLIIVFGLAQSLRGSFYALLFYLWMAYFRPETWLWYNFVSDLNLSLIVGVFVVIRTFFSSEKIRFGFGQFLVILFLLQSSISTFNSPALAYSFSYFSDFVKIAVMCIVLVTLVSTEDRLQMTLLVIAVSLGFEAAKQGWAQFVTNPGGENINEIVMLGDNNGVAVGMFMLVPILVALARTATTKFERVGHRLAAFGVLYRGIVTYSRGGFLAASALALHYVLRSKRKVVGLVAIAIVVGVIAPVLPDTFWNRMSTIEDASEDPDSADGSVRGRIHFWRVAMIMANEHPFAGVGHNAYNQFYDQYDFSYGMYKRARSVHSTWLGVLAELGYPGFILFVAIFAYSLWQCWRVGRMAKARPELKNLAIFAAAIEAGLVSAAVGGTFVIFQYNEMLWHLFALSTVVVRLARERQPVTETVPARQVGVVLEPRTSVAMAASNPVTRTPLAS